MSIDETLKQIKSRCEAATDVVYQLCKGSKKFRMSIPARLNDTDIVLYSSLKDIDMLMEMVEFTKLNIREDVKDIVLEQLEEIAEKYK